MKNALQKSDIEGFKKDYNNLNTSITWKDLDDVIDNNLNLHGIIKLSKSLQSTKDFTGIDMRQDFLLGILKARIKQFNYEKENEIKKEKETKPDKIKYTDEKAITAFLRTYRNKESQILRFIAYFEDTSSINNIAEFSTMEDEVYMGMFTKAGQLRAHVKHLLKDMFDCGCWIEVEEAHYEGSH